MANHTKRAVFIQFGSPEMPDLGKGIESMHCILPGNEEDSPYWWCECAECKKIGIEFLGRSDRMACRCVRDPGGRERVYGFDSPRLVAAYDMARTYEFWSPSEVRA